MCLLVPEGKRMNARCRTTPTYTGVATSYMFRQDQVGNQWLSELHGPACSACQRDLAAAPSSLGCVLGVSRHVVRTLS